jgi:beta-lactamase class A
MTQEKEDDPQPVSTEELAAEVEALLLPLGGRTALAACCIRPRPRSHPPAQRGPAGEHRRQEPALAEDTLILRADDVFPSASLIKVCIAIEVLRRAELGQLSLEERFDTAAELRVGGGGILDYLDSSTQFTLRDLCLLMLALSDNTASNFLLDLVGIGEVNETLSHLKLRHTRLARRFMDFDARASGRDNLTSASDMVALLTLLHANALPGAKLLREWLLAQRVADDLKAWLPPDTPLAIKTGELPNTGAGDGVFHAAGMLTGPVGEAIFCVLTAGWDDLPAAHIAVGNVLRALWCVWCT